MINILERIKKANLVGRGGGCYPVAEKWQAVYDAMLEKRKLGIKCHVVCNAAEGEPDVGKDFYILDNYADKVVDGIKLAMNFLGSEKGFIYLNPHYYGKLKKKLESAIGDSRIEIIKKPKNAGYIGGEETSALNAIEGKRIEPRFRPPYPPTAGLYGCPTLVNNVETFYNVYQANNFSFANTRFYYINGDCVWSGTYELPDSMPIERILRETKNYPDFDFFVQVGGGASGEILSDSQLDRPATGAGSIKIFNKAKHKPIDLVRRWVDFYANESCGQCVPCREGTYRLKEIIGSRNPDWKTFEDLLYDLKDSSFCGLGCSVAVPILSLMKNVVDKDKNFLSASKGKSKD